MQKPRFSNWITKERIVWLSKLDESSKLVKPLIKKLNLSINQLNRWFEKYNYKFRIPCLIKR